MISGPWLLSATGGTFGGYNPFTGTGRSIILLGGDVTYRFASTDGTGTVTQRLEIKRGDGWNATLSDAIPSIREWALRIETAGESYFLGKRGVAKQAEQNDKVGLHGI